MLAYTIDPHKIQTLTWQKQGRVLGGYQGTFLDLWLLFVCGSRNGKILLYSYGYEKAR